MQNPNPRYFRHVKIKSEDFDKEDGWEFYCVVKNWKEFNPDDVLFCSNEKILRDVDFKGMDIYIPDEMPFNILLILLERNIEVFGLERWVVHNMHHYEKLIEIINSNDELKNRIAHTIDIQYIIKNAIKNENISALYRLRLFVDLTPHKNEIIELGKKTNSWISKDGFSGFCQIKKILKYIS